MISSVQIFTRPYVGASAFIVALSYAFTIQAEPSSESADMAINNAISSSFNFLSHTIHVANGVEYGTFVNTATLNSEHFLETGE